MAVHLVECIVYKELSTVFHVFEKPFEQAQTLDLMFLLMFLPAVVLIIEGVVFADSAPVFVVWICRLELIRCLKYSQSRERQG